jgi:competence protein ComEC
LWAEQWRLSFALAPLGLLLFGQVSLVGLLANVLAIPWVTWVVTPLAFAGVLVPPLWDGAAIAVQGLGVCLEAMAHWPWAVLEKPAVPLAWSLGAVIGAVLLMAPLPWASRGCGLLLALPWLWWVPPGVPQGEVRVVALDVGQGSAVVVQTAHHTLLYDTGPRYSQDSDAGHRVVVPWLRAQGLQPDRVALSHADIDHTGGTRAVLSRFPGADVLADPGWFNPPPGWTGSVSPCAAPLLWQWDGVVFEVLHPGAGALVDTRGSRSKTNPLSCVIRVTARGGSSALLTGDLEAAQERALVERLGPAALAADWLLVPHHGSRTSSTAALLAAVGPRVAVVQAGYRNRFGHPASDVLARYLAQGVQPTTTVECGSATWQSDSAGNLGCERERKHRYWQHSSALPASLSRP